jgi:hypothetical protein
MCPKHVPEEGGDALGVIARVRLDGPTPGDERRAGREHRDERQQQRAERIDVVLRPQREPTLVARRPVAEAVGREGVPELVAGHRDDERRERDQGDAKLSR